jgi:hypothetical protein
MGAGAGAARAVRAAIFAAALGSILSLPWEHVDTELVRDTTYDGVASAPIDAAAFTRTTERIASHGELLEAWVYLPKGVSK